MYPKPLPHDYPDDWRRRYTKNIYAALIGLKETQPVFATTTYSTDLVTAVKRIWLRHSSMDATVLGNFDVVDRNVTPDFTRTGMWYEFYTGDSLNVADTSATLAFQPGEYRLYTTVKLVKPWFTAIDENHVPGIVNPGHVVVYPNPSDGRFSFVVNLQQPSPAKVTVFNMYGVRIENLVLGHLNQGINTFTLDLSAEQGNKRCAGIYFYRLDAGNLHESGKMIVK